jgi:predicted XRE-type DNA-binding protein
MENGATGLRSTVRTKAGAMMAAKKRVVETGSGNVFKDLGLPDAEQRLAKAELARVIRRLLQERKLSQAEAAELLGIAQPDVSDLVRGRLARFSMERLERFLLALGMNIRIQIGPPHRTSKRGALTVEVVGAA